MDSQHLIMCFQSGREASRSCPTSGIFLSCIAKFLFKNALLYAEQAIVSGIRGLIEETTLLLDHL